MAIPYLDKINCTIHYGCTGITDNAISSVPDPEDDKAKTIKLYGVKGDKKDRCYYHIGDYLEEKEKVLVKEHIKYNSFEDGTLQYILSDFEVIQPDLSKEENALLTTNGRIGIGHGKPPVTEPKPSFSNVIDNVGTSIDLVNKPLTIGYEINRKFLSRNDRARTVTAERGARMKFDLIEYKKNEFVIVNLRAADE